MPRIFDNIQQYLVPAFREIHKVPNHADSAAFYLKLFQDRGNHGCNK